MIKLVATDIDGTLIGHKDNNSISDRNLSAIEKLRRLGIRFVLATGRSLYEVTSLYDQIGYVCDTICFNGGVIYNEKKEKIWSAPLSEDNIHLVSVLSHMVDVDFILHYENYAGCLCSRERIKEVISTSNIMHHGMDFFPDSFYRDMKEMTLEEVIQNPPIKAETMFKSLDQIAYVKNMLAKEKGLACASSMKNNIEINNVNANKGLSLIKMCDYYKIDYNSAMCFGDSENDIPMLSQFCNSYAMGNSTLTVKKSAAFICDSCDNDGFYQVIKNI